ncbi:HNH endonuclease [Streptomyces sp. NPDC001978]|uniref:HNH endonuclease n=1 Tax=Streptomyces sp. NPDC001978 TaxID=3364627 RepID=UPI00367369EE
MANPDKRSANYARKREHYAANAEQIRRKNREWRKANPDQVRAHWQLRRARKAAAQVEEFSAQDLADFWDDLGCYGCVYCGAPYEHADHVQPLSKGGEHSRANLLPACADCNLSKGASDPVEYVNQRYGLRLSWPA